MKKPSIAHLTMGPVESQEFLAHQIISIETHSPGDADSHSLPRKAFPRAVPNIIGDISRPIDPPPGCRFTLRCPYSDETCSQTFLKLDMNQGDKHLTACHRQDALDS